MKWGIIAGIILFGAFLRWYHFSDWLHFELDQSRDAIVVNKALENGPGELTLLGPKAAGTLLRLGPVFYYFQYLGGLLFGSTPQGIAYPTMILSVLTIPLVYLFLRRLFDRKISLSLTAVASVSVFLVIYGRFAWNPNSIPFFVLLAFYGLLRAIDDDEKHKTAWFLTSAASFAVATQLHFLAFIAIPLTISVFLIIKRPKLKLKAWLGAFFIIAFLYLPVIINEIKTHGANASQFFETVTKKSNKKAEYNLIEKGIRAYSELSRGSFLIISGQEQTEIPGVIVGPSDGTLFLTKCDESCSKTWGWGIIAIIIFTTGAVLSIYRFLKEKNKLHRDTLLLTGIWTVVTAGIFVPLAYDISIRFFLLLVPITFLFLGVILDFLNKIFRKGKLLSIVVIIILIIANMLGVFERFHEFSLAATENVEQKPDRILKERTRVTLEQQIMITDYIKSFYKENGFPILIKSEAEYQRALSYHFKSANIPFDTFNIDSVYRKGNYFLVFVTNENFDKKAGKYSDNFNIAEKKQFGTLTLARLIPKEDKIITEECMIKSNESSEKVNLEYIPGTPVRYTWSEVWKNRFGTPDDELDESETEDMNSEQ